MNWIVTVPKTTSWETYKKELWDVEHESLIMNYRVRYFPKKMQIGDRMYIVHDGYVKGWMKIVGLVDSDGFTCRTTGIYWGEGKFIQRSGKFHEVVGIRMKGFRGVREFSELELIEKREKDG